MDIQKIMNRLLPNQEVHTGAPLNFRTGQIFYGTVQKLFPNHLAEIQLGAHKLIAKMEVPLKSGEGYWLQVTSTAHAETTLKLLPSPEAPFPKESGASVLLRQLSLPNEQSSQQLSKFLMDQHILLTKEEIMSAGQFLKRTDNIQLGLQTIKMIKEMDLPLNEAIFRSFMAAGKDVSTSKLIDSLQTALYSEQSKTAAGTQILSLLNQWNGEEVLKESISNGEKQYNGKDAYDLLRSSLQKTGLFYESELLRHEMSKEQMNESLKPLLIKYLQEANMEMAAPVKKLAEQLLFRMNGQQLLSFENGPIQQIIYEIPIQLADFRTDLTIQWAGKKTAEGEINPDFCRIIFYLELEYMKETVVDMQVQNRVVTVSIMNESTNLKTYANPLLPGLKAGLKEMGYTLSQVLFKQSEKKEMKAASHSYYNKNQAYKGVDIKI